MSYHAFPPDFLAPEPTPADIAWAASWRRYGAEVDRLQSDPDAMRAFSARCRLLGEAASSASRTEEPHLTAGGRGTATVPGLA